MNKRVSMYISRSVCKVTKKKNERIKEQMNGTIFIFFGFFHPIFFEIEAYYKYAAIIVQLSSVSEKNKRNHGSALFPVLYSRCALFLRHLLFLAATALRHSLSLVCAFACVYTHACVLCS